MMEKENRRPRKIPKRRCGIFRRGGRMALLLGEILTSESIRTGPSQAMPERPEKYEKFKLYEHDDDDDLGERM